MGGKIGRWLAIALCLGLAGQARTQGDRLRIYGFFDLEAEVGNQSRTAKYLSFDQHHLNFISIFRLDSKTHLFSEIEWEHGPSHKLGEMSGKIYMARAFLEYKYTDALILRAGKFLPPFGIYNEMHDATPAFISTALPYSVYGEHLDPTGRKTRLYAKFATGFWLLDRLPIAHWALKYNLYVSNGRGPDPAKKDDNPNKGVGLRLLFLSPTENVKLGMSYYADRNGLSYDTRQQALDFDADLRFGNYLFQGELFFPRCEKIDVDHRPTGSFRNGFAYYLLAGYTVNDRWTPFLRRDYYDPDTKTPSDAEAHYVIGLNVAATHRVHLKAEIHRVRFQNSGEKGYEKFLASLAVAF